ncbi:asialoglycoprotein receptor 1-like isoform X2 [Pristis pectinata]|uniref:asialoglycoprotein receptor 1-like isoform X2 n=1 Tax=Pristis pectinata TaxID=685728 RepID=UPI00223E8AC8|nr:asialoglycoprotein receptor 1-like isoform X2 [Pristis pectinata]
MKDSTGDPQDPAKGTPGAASRKPFGIVTCILLGLFVLLTVMFVVELLKFRQISGEIKDLKDDMTEKLARMKDELTAINQMGHTLLAGHGNIENKISSLTDLIRKWHSDLRAQIADMKNNCRPRFECPDQWTLFGQKCYYFSPRVEDWLSSQRFCASNMANLAVIDRSDKQAFVVNEIKSTRHWIGLNESSTGGTWLWVDGTDYPSSQKFWSSGEPRSIGSYEPCVGTNRDGNWVVYSCSEKMNFICERPVFCRFK